MARPRLPRPAPPGGSSGLDPQARRLLDAWAALASAAAGERTARSVRDSDRSVQALQPLPEPVQRMDVVAAQTPSGDLPVHVYTPLGAAPPLPVLVYFHGGGFVIGGESYDSPLRALANRSRHLVCAVDYRLAPEHPFPAAEEDAWAATEWLVGSARQLGGDDRRISVGGDSSGGNLAAVVALQSAGRLPLCHQLLIYPMLDATCSQPSVRTLGTGYGFTKEKIEWYFDQYLPAGTNRRDPRVSPLFAPLPSGLPPAFVATAEFDPLRDEGEAYARRLRRAGVPVTLKRYPGMIHGFLQMAGVLDGGERLISDAAQALRNCSS